MAKLNKKLQQKLGRMWRKKEPLFIVVGIANWYSHYRKGWERDQEVKNEFTTLPRYSTP